MSEEASAEATDAARGPDVTRLVHEAASKSGLLWVCVPGGETRAVWHVWHDDGDERGTGPAAYVVSGPGEQDLPWLPEHVEVVLRSKDTGGRLLTMRATAEELAPGTAAWEAAAEVLRPERLNGTGDVVERWRQGCTLHVLRPHGRPIESPGQHDDASGAAPVRPAAGTTTGWRPWHWRGRAGARRNTTA
ncbi:hypothetical protein [Phycicoccus avicenniae]|uniref:hypothetical protein n=1 Tax=Phycicoccus avicenniae TaxID=2828860 RepID=UPI003D2A5771